MGLFISRKWRYPKITLWLIIVEFLPIVAVLALTGIASPDLYRTKLWQEGGDLGFSSKPSTILYAYANYRPVKTPMVWSSFNTQFNLVVSVLAMFLLLVKITMHITSTWYPIIAAFVQALLTALWAVAIHAQTAADTIDPDHSNKGAPWYITKSCSVATSDQLQKYCAQAKSTFAVAVILLALAAIQLILAIWSMIPTQEQKLARASKLEEKWHGSPLTEFTAEEAWRQQWEAGMVPPTPGTTGGLKSPMTPRTIAFNTLGASNRRQDLPLRTYG